MNLNRAIELARRRPLIKPRGSSSISRMVAILTDGTSEFIGENSYKSHPLVRYFTKRSEKICRHAEADAVIKAVQYFTGKTGVSRKSFSDVSLEGFTLSIARVLADGSTGLAKPCQDCDDMIRFFGIDTVEYTT